MTVDETSNASFVTPAKGHGTVLIADDDPVALEMISIGVMEAGWDVVTAKDGLEALKTVSTEHVDALILDMRMPKMDGYEVCLELCRRGRTLPILVITGRIGDTESLGLLNVAQTIRKPVDPFSLHSFLDAIPQPAGSRE